jgi:hypothetical protein
MFPVIERPQLLPGCDFLTGTDIGPFLDLNLNTDNIRNGWVYVAQTTVEEMAKSFGMASADEATVLRDEVGLLYARKAELEAELEAAHTAIDALTAAGYPKAPAAKKVTK